MNRTYLIILILAIGSLAINSCKTSKVAEEKTVAKTQAVDTIFHNMQEHQLKYKWFAGKFMAIYKSGDKKQTFSGQFRIRKDSVIWLGIYATMNIEVFRILITPDSIKMLNRLDKSYF
jgi:outer membrane lipoprotein-sorting protein